MGGIADVACVFGAEAAAGVLAFLPAVEVKEGGRRFFQTGVALAVAALAIGHGARAAAGGYAQPVSLAGATLALALLATGAAGAYLRALGGSGFERARPFLLAAAALAGLALAVDGAALALAEGPVSTSTSVVQYGGAPPRLPVLEGAGRVLVPLSMLSGAALLGSVTLAMVLGHFYLVIPRLSIDPLARLARAYLAASVARALVFGAALACSSSLVLPGGRSVLLDAASLLLPRALFGLAGPVVLALLALGTVRVKAVQSATGILYGAVVFVVIGELLAASLLASAGLPL